MRSFVAKNRGTFAWTLSAPLALFLCVLPTGQLFAQKQLEVEFNLFNLPSCRQTLAALSLPALATFENRPLGECLNNLAAAYRVSIWIDRRVDRSRLVTTVGLGASESPDAGTTMGRISAVAKLGGADAGLIENVVYVGPPGQIGVVQRAAARLHNEIMASRNSGKNVAKVESKALEWSELATPTELLESIRQQWAITVQAELPHDLLHAGKLPTSTLATHLSLLLSGFELQAECERGGQFVTAPITQESIWKAEYADKEVQASRVAAARKDFPNAIFQTRGKVCTVIGPAGFHLKLLSVNVPVARNREAKFTIPEFRAPLERVVGDLAKHLNFEVRWSPDIPQSERLVVMTFGVPIAKTPDEILSQIAVASGLKISRKEQTIYVSQ